MYLSRNGIRFITITSIVIAGTLGGLFFWHHVPHKSPAPLINKTFIETELGTRENIIPIAVIGSGPAGLMAALYSARAQYYTVVFRGEKPGGQLMGTTDVENWPGIAKKRGPDLMQGLEEQAKGCGVICASESIAQVDFSVWPFILETKEGAKVQALSVIIATGSLPKLLNVPGEQEYWGKGVTTCAVCDAPFYKDKEVVVIGGGDSAAEEALQLSAYAKKVTLLVRGERMRASSAMQERVKSIPSINIVYHAEIVSIEGSKTVSTGTASAGTASAGAHVTGINIKKNGVPELMKTDGVFLAIGHLPNTGIFKEYIDCDTAGYIHTIGRSQATSIPGIFAAGEVADHSYMQAGVAAGDGIKAALDATRFLGEHHIEPSLIQQFKSKLYNPQSEKRLALYKVVSMEDFDKLISTSAIPVIIDFYTLFCPSCLAMLPHLESVAAEFEGAVTICKVDGTELPKIMERYEVTSVPTMLVFKENMLIGRHKGSFSRAELAEFVQQFTAGKSAA